MSLVIGDNFSYQGRNPLDSRMLFDTIAAMKNYNENYLPDITLAFNKEDGKMYVFNRTNDVDEDTGKWREFEGGAGVTSYDDLTDKLIAGDNITIEDKNDFSAIQGPCPDGFHIPTTDEWNAILNAGIIGQSSTLDWLHIPMTGNIESNCTKSGDDWFIKFWTVDTDETKAYDCMFEYSGAASIDSHDRSFGQNIRAFKDEPVVPDNTWTETNTGLIWENAELGLISILVDTDTYVTIQNKNLGATEVFVSGDTMSESNCGYYYQWGNNHGFSFDPSSITTSSTLVDASSYGPSEYDSSTFITVSNTPRDWSSVKNDDLWGAETGIQQLHNVISATVSSGESIQVSELPAATSENEGKVYQYIGADTQDYKHDFFYENKYTEGTNGYYAFLITGAPEAYYATSETPSDGDPIYIEDGEIVQIPLGIEYWVVDAESPSGYSLYAVDEGQSMPTTRDSTQDIPGEPGGYKRVSVEVQEGNYDTLKNKPVYVGTTTQQGYGWTAEYEVGGGQTETYDFLTLVDELPENGMISVYNIEEEEWFYLAMQDGLAYGEDTVTRNSSIDQDVTVTTKEVNEKYYDIIGITNFPTPSSKYEEKIYRYVGGDTVLTYPNDNLVGVFNQELVTCQYINGSYYWTKYGLTPAVGSLHTDWEGGYGKTNNYYNDSATTIISYNGKLYTGTVDWSTFEWTWEELPTGTDDYNDLENKPLELEETTVNAYAFTIDAGASMGVTVYTKEITNGATLYRILNGKLEPFSENATLVINGSSYATDSGVPMTRHQENDTEATLYSPKVNEPYTELFQNLSMNESDVAFATVTLNGTTATLSNAFVTAETFVDYIVKNGTPAGTITISVANGSVTISSTATENLILLLRLEKVNSKSVILN